MVGAAKWSYAFVTAGALLPGRGLPADPLTHISCLGKTWWPVVLPSQQSFLSSFLATITHCRSGTAQQDGEVSVGLEHLPWSMASLIAFDSLSQSPSWLTAPWSVNGQGGVFGVPGLWLWVVISRWRTAFSPSIFTSIDQL